MKNSDNIIISNQPNNKTEVIVNSINGISGFDQVLNYLINLYNVKMLEYIHGEHDVRLCKLLYNNITFEFNYDTLFGSYFVATDASSEKIILDFANRIDLWLANTG